MLITVRFDVVGFQDVTSDIPQFPRRDFLQRSRPAATWFHRWSAFDPHRRKEEARLAWLILRNNFALSDRAHERFVHRAFKLTVEPPYPTTPQVYIVRTLGEHGTFYFDNANQTVSHISNAYDARIRSRRAFIGDVFTEKTIAVRSRLHSHEFFHRCIITAIDRFLLLRSQTQPGLRIIRVSNTNKIGIDALVDFRSLNSRGFRRRRWLRNIPVDPARLDP